MDIQTFGGEFKLIAEMTRNFPRCHDSVRVTVGDDAAVVETGEGDVRVFTTDLLVEGEHFDRRWSSPRDIGTKTLEVNVSDVAAMGAVPEFLLLNVALPRDIDADFALQLYEALRAGCRSHGITLLGGDTTRSPVIFLSATLTGRTAHPVLRSTARAGDLIAVTGDVGAAAAAVVCYRNGLEPPPRVGARHRTPHARVDVSTAVARHARALLDVSDGVASEVRHIAEASGVGARVDGHLLPILEDTRQAALAAGLDPVACGLSGGEDFELLFALPPHRVGSLRQTTTDFTIIGEFLPPDAGLTVVDAAGTSRPLPAGYDHFSG